MHLNAIYTHSLVGLPVLKVEGKSNDVILNKTFNLNLYRLTQALAIAPFFSSCFLNLRIILQITGRQIPEVVESCVRFIKKFGK